MMSECSAAGGGGCDSPRTCTSSGRRIGLIEMETMVCEWKSSANNDFVISG